MSMFCYQCQETLGNKGCTVNGICGKRGDTAILQDLLIYTAKGISVIAEKAGRIDNEVSHFVTKALFTTITNVNFNDDNLVDIIKQGLVLRDKIKAKYNVSGDLHDCAVWTANTKEGFLKKADNIGVLSTVNEDVRSLRELLTYGLKGVAAYVDHAFVLGFEDQAVFDFMIEGLASTTKDLSVDEMITLVMKTGEAAVGAMAILDRANTET